jgi:hypothetical protein
MNTDKPRDDNPERPTDYEDLLNRILERRQEIRRRQGTLSDSTDLIREERDRRLGEGNL